MKEIQEKIVILPKETMVELELISRDSFKEVFGVSIEESDNEDALRWAGAVVYKTMLNS